MSILMAIVLGALFGFVLQRVGAADPDKIISMLRLRDLHLMKAIASGVAISSILLFLSLGFGLVDASHTSIKALHWGVVLGGLLLGVGWALSGYCPGTGVVAAGTGRTDSLFFILGGLIGAALFSQTFEAIEKTGIFTPLLGGKVSLVETGSSVALIEASWSPFLAVGIGLVFLLIAKFLPTTE